MDINLKKNCLSDPFDFVTLPVMKMNDKEERWRISSRDWNPMIIEAFKRKVPTADIDYE